MASTNLNFLIEQIEREKGIPKEVILETLEDALLKAAQKKFGLYDDLEAHYNDESGEVELFQFKTVVRMVDDGHLEISLDQARKLDPETEIGDSIGVKLDNSDFGRIAVQVAKQVITQKVHAAERDQVYDDYKDRVGDLIAGSVRRIERGNIIIDVGRTEAILYAKDQSQRETYRVRDRILAYVVDVTKTTKGPQIILSRTDIGLLLKLFEMEVPEIAEGIVQIISAAREPSFRSKIAVTSRDQDVDPVGACVGMKGSRVQNIVQELRGEKIDIIVYHPDPVKYVCNALAPAIVSQVLIDEDEHLMEVTVPDDQLSLAIGTRGQNVRLASQLTGWRIDIQSESKVERMAEQAREIYMTIDGVDEGLATTLTQLGFLGLDDIIKADIDDLEIIPGLNATTAAALIKRSIEIKDELLAAGVDVGSSDKDESKTKVVKTQPTEDPDDDRPELLKLKNVDEELMQRMNEAGIYSLKDLIDADMDAKGFAEKFDISSRKARGVMHSAKLKSGDESVLNDEADDASVEE